MIRTIDMQSVLNQSTATEKVNQTHQQSQDMQTRHFALTAEETRVRKGSSVTDARETENTSNEVERDKHGAGRERRRQGGHRDESSQEEEQKQTSTNRIDVTV